MQNGKALGIAKILATGLEVLGQERTDFFTDLLKKIMEQE